MGQKASSTQPSKKRSVRALSTAAIGLLASMAIAIPVLAEISSNGENTWGVYDLDTSTETDSIESHVFAIEQIGDIIYVGGKFLEARPSSTGTAQSQPYLAAFDAGSGDFISSFRPQLESAVYALEASSDGTRLFVGGEFRSIDGDSEAHGLAALDPISGAIDSTWRAKVTNTSGARPIVYSLTLQGGQLYAAGRFDQVGGGNQALHYTEQVARVSETDGSVDTTLSTNVTGGAVWGIAVAPDGSKIYLAGRQDTVDGDSAGADYAVLDATGALIPSFSDHGGNSSNPSRWYGQDVVAVGDLVFWGGSEHIVRVFSAIDGSQLRQHTTDTGGDYQDLEVVGDRVYGSCHCYTNHYADFDWWNRGGGVPEEVVVSPIKYVAAYSAITGEYLPSFFIDASATQAGVWAIHGADDGCLWVGGDISRITTVAGGDRAAGGFAEFCEGEGGDNRAPDTPPNLVQTRAENYKIVIRWDASFDNVAVDQYEISRDGVVVATAVGTGVAQFWFTDTGVDIASSYTYEVVAEDAAGNRSAPATLVAATAGFDPGPDEEAPTQPAALTQTWAEDHKVVIQWDASTDNIGVDHYEISNDGIIVATETATAANQYWLTTTGLDAGTTYRFTVVALDEAGNRSTAAEIDAITTGQAADEPPLAPTGLRSTLQTKERIVLNWTAPAGGAAGYVVQRDDGAGFIDVATTTGLWFTDLNVGADTAYTYRVLAVDAGGQRSDPSAELVVSTLP